MLNGNCKEQDFNKNKEMQNKKAEEVKVMLVTESNDSFAAILNKQAKKINFANETKIIGSMFSNIKPLNYTPIISNLKQVNVNSNNSKTSTRKNSKDSMNDLNKLTPLHLAKDYLNNNKNTENVKSEGIFNGNKNV